MKKNVILLTGSELRHDFFRKYIADHKEILGKYDSKEIFAFLENLINESIFDQSKIEEFKQLTYRTQENDRYTLLVKRILNYFISYKYREGIIDKLIKHFIPISGRSCQ